MLAAICCYSLVLTGCVQDKCNQTITYTTWNPVYMSYEDMRSAIANEGPRELRRPGKIYFYGHYVFISEINEGVHIIDNLDVANPQNIGFIVVPGNNDIAVKGNSLYADSYVDLVTLDISDVLNVRETDRERDVFPYRMHLGNLWADAAQGVVREFVEAEVTESYDCNDMGQRSVWGGGLFVRTFGGGMMTMDAAFSSSNSGPTVNLPPSAAGFELAVGVGGSMARFTLMNNHLYTVTDQSLLVFDISELSNPSRGAIVQIGWNIETIFPFQHNRLFIGSQTGMFVYDVSNGAQPSYLSQFQHARSCDPVVVEGDYAYVTLRGGTECGGFTNQLDVIRISNITQPVLEASYSMVNPHGLGIRNGTLFICDGEAGLKVYNAADPRAISQNQIAHFPNIHAFDVIPLTTVLLMIGEDGFYQYDYSDLNNIRQISHIPIVTN